MYKIKFTLIFLIWCYLFFVPTADAQTNVLKNKMSNIAGRVFRSDTNQPVVGAKISFIPYHGQTLTATTDENGNYFFPQMKIGKYKIDIALRYKTMAQSPCSLLGSRAVKEKNSNVTMKDEGLGLVEIWVSIDPFKIVSSKPIKKDFDVACKGTYKNS